MVQNPMSNDLHYMREALAEAEKGRYSAAPNPAVGCVVVKNDTLIARGYHRCAGEAHAEAMALAAAGEAAHGATAYVTLEPCNHQGRTGPCAEALINAGIKRVVYAIDDPNPGVAGGGAKRLQAAGVVVEHGLLAAEAAQLNRGFLFRAKYARPRVTIKIGMSLDGKVALANGQSQWITGREARTEVQHLRASAGAVMSGIGTVLADDPSLNVREPSIEHHGRQPLRVVVDSKGRLPVSAKMLSLAGQTIVFVGRGTGAATRLAQAGATVVEIDSAAGGLDIATMLNELDRFDVNDVLLEAGPRLVGSFIAAGYCDQLIVYLAAKILGQQARSAFALDSPAALADAGELQLESLYRLGNDVAMHYYKPSD